ncbi:ribosome maturation factor RimM [Deinococcus taeanensis]|uniref:ribosome maturation factor RimM n=1 Tax=Deinococcus taeanensis TaxID=2737050 RepID=UPI001CDC6A4E|nr:ribosome maturation factor RimM [Deinococcus taeanensis]UBV43767.1 ribosome maturation factor RimM [Deinococcus taeanensis]
MTGEGERTRLGYFLGPHGVKGGVKVYVLGDAAQFSALRRVYIESRGWLRVSRVEQLAPGVALHLAGVSSREGAEELRGLNVYAADSDLPEPEEGIYYYHELRGLAVIDASGAPVGDVVDVEDAGHQDLLLVRHERGESFVPLQAPYVMVNLDERRRPASLTLTGDTPANLLHDEDGDDAGLPGAEGGPRDR